MEVRQGFGAKHYDGKHQKQFWSRMCRPSRSMGLVWGSATSSCFLDSFNIAGAVWYAAAGPQSIWPVKNSAQAMRSQTSTIWVALGLLFLHSHFGLTPLGPNDPRVTWDPPSGVWHREPRVWARQHLLSDVLKTANHKPKSKFEQLQCPNSEFPTHTPALGYSCSLRLRFTAGSGDAGTHRFALAHFSSCGGGQSGKWGGWSKDPQVEEIRGPSRNWTVFFFRVFAGSLTLWDSVWTETGHIGRTGRRSIVNSSVLFNMLRRWSVTDISVVVVFWFWKILHTLAQVTDMRWSLFVPMRWLFVASAPRPDLQRWDHAWLRVQPMHKRHCLEKCHVHITWTRENEA